MFANKVFQKNTGPKRKEWTIGERCILVTDSHIPNYSTDVIIAVKSRRSGWNGKDKCSQMVHLKAYREETSR